MSSTLAQLPKIPKPEPSARPQTKYTATCAALKVKPNSRVAAREEQLDADVVDISSNYIGGAGFEAVTDILSKNPRLEVLNAADNGLNNESVVFFCRAVAAHPTLRSVDFSRNPLSLPAALALLDLLHKNKRIAEIKLSDTHIDEAVLRRIRRALNLNRIHSNAAAANANSGAMTPFEKVKAEFAQRGNPKKERAAAARAELEEAAAVKVAEWIRAKGVTGPRRGDRGWASINLCVSCTPTDFVSEMALIQDVICPRLNEQFAARKLHFTPLFMYNDLGPHHHRNLEPHQRLAIRADYAANVAKAAPFFIQLLGDRVSLAEFENPAVHEFPPILQREYELAGEGCSIIMVRRPALQLNVPAPLIPLVSSDPQLAYPDANTHMVKAAVANAQGKVHPLAAFDIAQEQRKWEGHCAFKRRVLENHPSEFVCTVSHAEFDAVSATGHLQLKGLDSFVDGLTKRLVAAVGVMYPVADSYAEDGVDRRISAFLTACAERAVGKKNLLGKLDLYAVTPPSRNMTLVYGAGGSGLTSCMGAFVQRCVKKNSYIVAHHFTHQCALTSEPSDPRTVFMSLAAQLLPDGVVPSHIKSAVDVVAVKDFFIQTLANVAGETADGKAIVLVVDGLDDIDPMVVPCPSLRVSDTGVEMWNPAPPPSTVAPSPVKNATPKQDGFDFIPICLARNVRWVASCTAFSTTHRRLEARGHDSCEPVPIGEIGDNDVEVVVTAALAPHGIALTEEELAVIRGKDDCHLHDYLRFAVDRIKHQDEVPGNYVTRMTVLEELPQTLTEMCQQRINSLESEFGAPLVSLCCGVLLASRWGVTELELRELLAKPNPARLNKSRASLSGELFNRLLRRLAPALQPYITRHNDQHPTGASPMNALDMVVRIQCRVFAQEARSRYFASSPTDVRDPLHAIHQHLAHHYLRLAQQTNHPLEAKGVKEFPYHAIKGRMWAMVEESVVSLHFVSQAYKLELGYQAARELIRAYNTVEAAPADELPNKRALLHKISEYVYFVRDHNINLAQYPHMVRQIAVTCGAETHLHNDAKAFFKGKATLSHFLVMNKSKAKLHRDAITDCHFAPSGMRFATCSDDRSMKICNLNGECVININQSSSKLKLLRYSPTSRYVVAVAEDRSTFVMDATNGNLVSKFHGHTSVIRSVVMSARGRFVATGSEDRTMKIWESETGVLLCTVPHQHLSHHTSAFGGVNAVVAHPLEEDKFFTMCDKKVLGWKLANSREQCDEFLCVNAHNSLPVANFHVVADGGFVVTTAKDLSMTPPNYTRAEDNIKVFSIFTGRCVATMSNGMNKGGSGAVMSAVSADEKVLASALFDGTLQLHQLHCRSYAPEAEEPIVVTPYRHFTGFRGHPVPRISHLAFSFDSKLIGAAGNQRQLKVWTTAFPTDPVPEPVEVVTAVADSTDEAGSNNNADGGPAADATKKRSTFVSTLDTAVDVPVVAEFLMEQQCVSMDWTQNPSGEADGGELIVGDVVGRLHSLRLRQS